MRNDEKFVSDLIIIIIIIYIVSNNICMKYGESDKNNV